MRQFKSKQGSGERRTASWWVPCGQVCIAALQFRAVVESRTKRPRQEEDDRAQNTNNFNDNLNNKTIFSLNATNRARWSIFLVHRFFSARTIFSFCAIGRRWKMWWRIFLAALARYAGRSLSAKNLSKRETRDRRRGSAFSPSRESILFFEKFY